MSTSGSYNFGLTGAEIIQEALETIGVAGAGDTISAEDQSACLRTLNSMVKTWQSDSIGLWKNREVELYPHYGAYVYALGSSGVSGVSGHKTEVSVAAVAGATAITVTLDDDFSNGDIIGFELSTGLIHWTVVNGTPAANVITISDALPSGVSIGGRVYPYTASTHCALDGFKTELSAAAVAGATTITVDSDDNITNGDFIGIELDDNTIQWTTVNGVPSANVVTLKAALRGAAAVDNHVYSYISKTPRPLEVVDVRRVNADGTENELTVVSRQEYMALPSKDSLGSPTQVYFDPQLNNAKLYLWPAFDDVQEYLKLTVRIPIEDFDVASNDPDFPPEWFHAMAVNLAVLVAPKFGKQVDSMLLSRAEALKDSVSGFDNENASIFFGVSRHGG